MIQILSCHEIFMIFQVPQYQQQIAPQMVPQQQQLPPQQQQLPPQQQQLPPQLIPQPPASQAQQVPPKQTRPGPGRPRKKSSPKQTPVNIQAHSASNPSTTNPNINPPAVNDQQQHAIAVDPRLVERFYLFNDTCIECYLCDVTI